ncbi:MAG: sensor histidine kinase [Myxococcaceae bacterium]|nr:sensor histidine kinase [Myxococcaceae bacterium]
MGGQLADFIEGQREEITQRWVEQLFATAAPASLGREEVIDSLREFLGELTTGLRQEYGLPQHTHVAGPSSSSKGHGKQRFTLGYGIGAVVREYGLLRDVLFQLVEEQGVAPSAREVRVLSKYLINGIADAVSQYALERDEELRQQAARHIGFMAHELRNPLASARLALGMMEQRGELPPSRSAQLFARSLQRVNELVDNALVEVRLRVVPEPAREPLELSELLHTIAEDSSVEVELKSLQLRIEAPSGMVLHADRRMLYSLLSNLLRNAVKFTRSGGTIHLRARAGGHRVTVDVEDECGGLPEDRMQSLFEPFVQVGQDRSGFGLGLAIARQVAEAHGGELRVHNLPGTGCVFVLGLPTSPPTPGPGASSQG